MRWFEVPYFAPHIMTRFQFFLLVSITTTAVMPGDFQRINESTTLEYTDEPPTISEAAPTYDYIVEIGFNLDEEKVPEYLTDIIYNDTSEKVITTADVFSLFGLNTIDLTSTLDLLSQLNIPSGNIFSMDGFDKFLTELRLDFKEFYNKVIIGTLGITGNPLRDVLMTLNIDVNNFSMGMAYGDPNPYDEFKKGMFTKENVESALQKSNRTSSELFIASRDVFLYKALETNLSKITDSLLRYGFDKPRALDLWKARNLTVENVYRVPAFKSLLDKLNRELNKKPSLGVLTDINNITINRKIYNTWRENQKIVELFAESISHKFILQIKDIVHTDLDNIIKLTFITIEPYEASLPYIELGTTSQNLENCKFVTLQNETIISTGILTATNHESYFEIPKGNITDLILGSPLICENKVYGIAREIVSENIILDSFSGASRIVLNGSLLSVLITVCVCVYF